MSEALILQFQRSATPDLERQLLDAYRPQIRAFADKWKGVLPNVVIDAHAERYALDSFRTFKPGAGASPQTHLYNHLSQLSRLNYDHQNVMKIPEHQIQHLGRVNQTQAFLTDKYDRAPTPEEIAKVLKMPKAHIVKILKNTRPDFVGDSDLDSITHAQRSYSQSNLLAGFRSTLPTQQRQQFDDITGYGGTTPLSPKLLGQKYGFKPYQVSRLKQKFAVGLGMEKKAGLFDDCTPLEIFQLKLGIRRYLEGLEKTARGPLYRNQPPPPRNTAPIRHRTASRLNNTARQAMQTPHIGARQVDSFGRPNQLAIGSIRDAPMPTAVEIIRAARGKTIADMETHVKPRVRSAVDRVGKEVRYVGAFARDQRKIIKDAVSDPALYKRVGTPTFIPPDRVNFSSIFESLPPEWGQPMGHATNFTVGLLNTPTGIRGIDNVIAFPQSYVRSARHHRQEWWKNN